MSHRVSFVLNRTVLYFKEHISLGCSQADIADGFGGCPRLGRWPPASRGGAPNSKRTASLQTARKEGPKITHENISNLPPNVSPAQVGPRRPRGAGLELFLVLGQHSSPDFLGESPCRDVVSALVRVWGLSPKQHSCVGVSCARWDVDTECCV